VYVTTDGQSASLSWNKAPFLGLRPNLYYRLTVAVLLIWGSHLTRGWVCRLQLLLGPGRPVIFGSESRRTCGHILLAQIRDFLFRRLLGLAGSRWNSRLRCLLKLPRCPHRRHHVQQLIVLYCSSWCHGNVFLNIRWCENKFLPNHCLANNHIRFCYYFVFRKYFPSRYLVNDHIRLIASCLRRLVPKGLTVYHRSVFSEGSARDVFLWLALS
jgi:hypothetical protein